MSWRDAFAPRRFGPAKPTAGDLAVWRALAEGAERIADNPAATRISRFLGAARKKQVVMPIGHQGADSPFAALQALGRAWPALSIDGRWEKAPELAVLSARCLEILDAAEGAASTRRRADKDD